MDSGSRLWSPALVLVVVQAITLLALKQAQTSTTAEVWVIPLYDIRKNMQHMSEEVGVPQYGYILFFFLLVDLWKIIKIIHDLK